VTAGIVSAVVRQTGAGGAYDRYIQTDASINRGNSGGPLFDMQGNVIGINNAIFSPSGGSVGIGFAIPAEIAAPIVQKLRSGQEIARGYLGIQIEPVNGDLADSLDLPRNRGEFVQSVEPGQPADKAGLRPGDVVTKVNGRDVTSEQTLSFIVANIPPGTRIPLEVYRQGQRRTVTAVVGKRPSDEELAQSQLFNNNNPSTDESNRAPDMGGSGEALAQSLGLQVSPLTPRYAQQLGVPADAGGLVILQVDPSADVGQKGLQPGDIVVSANYKSVEAVADLETIVAEAKSAGRQSVLLQIRRRGQPVRYLPFRLR
jgi:serine protease Do